MSVRVAKRGGRQIEGSYDIDVYLPNGKRCQYRRKFDRIEDAHRFEKDLLLGMGKTPGSRKRLFEIAKQYLEYCKIHQSNRTWEDKVHCFDGSILPFFGNIYPDDITAIDIDKYQERRLSDVARGYHCGATKGQRTVDKELCYLSACLEWSSSPSRGLCRSRLPRYQRLQKERQRPFYIPREDIMALINAMDLHSRALFLCMYHGGMRKDEVTNLEWKNVHLNKDTLFPRIEITGKGGKKRTITMTRTLRIALVDHAPCGVLDGLVFPDTNGKPIKDLRGAIWFAQKKCGITTRVTPHSFRHAFATHMIEAGADISTVKVALGHESIRTTQVYAHPGESYVRDAIHKTFD
jgi:integrase